MKVEILSVGNEVLSGKVVNTNASFLSIELEKIGYDVVRVVTVGDDKEELIKEVNSFLVSDIDYLVTTGGLGPTHDDFTKEVLFDTLGMELVEHQEAIDLLEDYFSHNYTKCNLKQALYPKGATLLKNDYGTAMGAFIEKDNKMYSVLVGPPFELHPMFYNYLAPILREKINLKKVVKEYIVMGIGESQVEELLQDYYKKHSTVEVAPYASIGKVRYQISGTLNNIKEFEEADQDFVNLMDEYIISDKNEEIEEKIYQELSRLGYKICFGESCTGGLLASKLINVNGSSSIIDQSFVTYSEQAKCDILGVNQEVIDKYGVVSEETVIAMVNGVCLKANSQVGVAVTGYAGPSGGTEKDPVGTVYYAIKVNEKVYSYKKFYKSPRNVLRQKVVMSIYYHLYRALINCK